MTIQQNTRTLAVLIFSVWATMASGDLYLPSMPAMAKYYNTTDDWLDLTVTANIACFTIFGILYGPLTDAYGRRKIFLFGMGIFVLGSCICASIPSLPWMIFGRFVQGAGSCVADIIVLSVVRDLYSGDKCAKVMSTMEMFMVISPTVAPILGGFIAKAVGWEANFYVILAFSIVAFFLIYLGLPETLPKKKRRPLKLRSILFEYKKLFKDKCFTGYCLVSGFVFSGLFVIIVGLPYLYQDIYGFSVLDFTYYMALGAIVYIAAAEINRRTVEHFGAKKLLWWGVNAFFVTGLINLVVAYTWSMDPIIVRISTAAYIFCMGFTVSNSAAIAIESNPEKAGTASAFLIAVEMLLSSIAITLTGYFYENSFPPIAWLLVLFAMLSLVTCYVVRKMESN